jgi:hypothetical protein
MVSSVNLQMHVDQVWYEFLLVCYGLMWTIMAVLCFHKFAVE